MRRSLVGLLIFLLSGLPGCASFYAEKGLPPLPPPGRLAVMPAPELPAVEFGGYLRGKGEGAAAGAVGGGLDCLAALGHGACSGSVCGAAVLLMLAICGTASAVSAVVGAVTTPDTEAIEQREQALQYATYNVLVQKPLRDYMVSAALENFADVMDFQTLGADSSEPRDYRSFATLGIETVLETGLTRVYLDNVAVSERDPASLQLYMEGKLRVIRSRDNQLLREETVRYHAGPSRPLEEWSAHNGKLLAEELEKGYEPLASYLYTKTYLVYPFPDRSFSGLLATFGLAPYEPAISLPPFTPFAPPKQAPQDYSTQVSSLKPLLRWEAFPRDSDRQQDPETMARVRNVRYELRVAALMRNGSLQTIYERQALPTAEHRVETALRSGSRYFWTVRARFDLDDRPRVTEWSSLGHPGDHQEPPFPSFMSYQFRTPSR